MKTSRVALITGGTSGIGREAAVLFAKAGAKVVVTGRRETEGQETVRFVRDVGGEGLFIQADVSREEDCRAMVDHAMKTFGRLDFAFNNAGIEGQMVPVTEQSVENFHKVMDINVLGVLLSMKYEIAAMRKTGGGAIVNNASIAGLIGMPSGSVYIASKHAVIGLTKSAALEVAKEGIRVNAVSPGAIETPMYDRFTGDEAETKARLASFHPVGRAGVPTEIAKAVEFLCSDGASFITGTNLVVDGGYTAQ